MMHDAAFGAVQEEPRLNFDTNVIGPTNANIIGGGGAGASPLQDPGYKAGAATIDW